MLSSSEIASNLATVRARMNAACARAGRDPASVTLVVVSKKQPPEAVRAAWEAGQRDFGENYVQELVAKREALADLSTSLRWHMIGHVQRNKVKFVAGRVALFQTADDMTTIDELARRTWADKTTQDVLLQVHIGTEESKRGCAEGEVAFFATVLLRSPTLRLTGLMCIPPPEDDPRRARAHLRRLRVLREQLIAEARGEFPDIARSVTQLSMGMTDDFEEAIEEGATIVRVGRAIFGARDEVDEDEREAT